MSFLKSKKGIIILSVVCIIVGAVLACSSFITNDYVKLAIVFVAVLGGMYGFMKALSGNNEEEITSKE